MSSTRSRKYAAREAGFSETDRDLRGYGVQSGVRSGAPGTPRPFGRGQGLFASWNKLMRFTLPTLGLFAALGGMVALTLGAGCASKKNPPTDSSTTAPLAKVSASSPSASALDVHPAPAPAYTPPAPTITLPPEPVLPPAGPLTPDPVLTQTPSLAAAGTGLSAPAAAPAIPAASTVSAGSTYTVLKGDTLYKIAKEHYGDGKQWARIVAANPGLSPASLKAGQKLNLP